MSARWKAVVVVAGVLGTMVLNGRIVRAAAFNYTHGLINIPVAEIFYPGQFEFGVSTALFTESGLGSYEFDYKFNLSLTDQFQLGLTYLNSTTIIGNFHYTFFQWRDLGNLRLSGGLQNISGATHLSSFDGYFAKHGTNLSPFLVLSWGFWDAFNAHVGIGKRRFETQTGFLTKTSGFMSLLNGSFWGFDYTVFNGKLMFEFDGKDMNLGYKVIFSPTSEFNLALTELFNSGVTNTNYDGAPLRYLTFGFALRGNLFTSTQDNMSAQIKEAQRKISQVNMLVTALESSKENFKKELEDLQKNKALVIEDLGAIREALHQEQLYLYSQEKDKKEAARKKHLGVTSIVGEKVVQLYYEAFEHYVRKEYLKAIEALTKAISLDPNVAMIYVRLGTVYFELEMYKEAFETWNRALDLEPGNKELSDMITKLKVKK